MDSRRIAVIGGHGKVALLLLQQRRHPIADALLATTSGK
jgi:hypothetical protein